MTWTHIATLLSVIGFVITAAGLVGVSFRVGRNAQTVNNYRESASAWEMKAKSQADEITALQQKLNDQDAVIKKLQERVAVLEDMATGKAAVADLAATITNSFANLQSRMDSLAIQIKGQQ